jgi:inosine-uridine nucleoside N-ribohydrolase
MNMQVQSKILRASIISLLLLSTAVVILGFTKDGVPQNKIRVIIDSDTNNELDDQHAIAYLLFNSHFFDVEGITVNRTSSGGSIEDHVVEAYRAVLLCGQRPYLDVYRGASGNYSEIGKRINAQRFDGMEAVNFIIKRAKIKSQDKLVLLAIGKLTNIALALKKDPSIVTNIKIVWLGSNYPDSKEYNLMNDTSAVSAILETDVEFEIVTVRLGKPTGTGAVIAYEDDIYEKMPGKGPKISSPVAGRHGKLFANFGDYSLSLFKLFPGGGDPKGRSFFDVVAIAILKNPSWGKRVEIAVPQLLPDGSWVVNSQTKNSRKIVIWEKFEKKEIMQDFYNSMDSYVLPNHNNATVKNR